jgi:predicted RNA-binding protein YlxR (DUF448 family)
VAHVPVRTCVGCRTRAAQADLVRFVRSSDAWSLDAAAVRAPGRGAYLCSERCAARVSKNKRYGGLAAAAAAAGWQTALRDERGRV